MTKKFSIADTFGVAAPAHLMVEGFADETHPRIPCKEPDFVFRKDHLRDLLAFLSRPDGDGLYIHGPTGCGKTSLVTQAAARLNWPVHAVTCHGRLELADLIGQFTLTGGAMQFVHGPLAQAVRDGHVMILNEIDLMDPSELAGLNDVIEGQPLVIPQNGGEVIRPHPKFRLVATGNSGGQGDRTGLYQGILRQNMAFMDRFRVMEVAYMGEADEKALLARKFPGIPEPITAGMVRVATEIRKLFTGGAEGIGILSVTMSTRCLIRWAGLLVAFKGAPSALSYALDRALTLRAEPEERTAIHRIAEDVFGLDWRQV